MSGYWGIGITKTVCPYYIRESEKMISCESEYEGVVACKKFTTEKAKIEYQKKHCFENCARCNQAALTERKYTGI